MRVCSAFVLKRISDCKWYQFEGALTKVWQCPQCAIVQRLENLEHTIQAEDFMALA